MSPTRVSRCSAPRGTRPLAARAQSLPNLPEVGFLYTGSASALPSRVTAFSDGLRSRGYVEGHNVSVITRTAEWRPDQYALTSELVKRNVRVVFAAGPAVVRYAKSATTTTPIVALDLIRSGQERLSQEYRTTGRQSDRAVLRFSGIQCQVAAIAGRGRT